jgi:pimeloyl-ACP methyl ester carboxylesterase
MLAAGEGDPRLFAAVVLVDVTPQMEDEGVEKIVGFMNAHLEEGFASLSAAADAVAAYLPHRPKPSDTSGLAKNLLLGDDGRYRWHWDPKFMTGDRRASAARDHERLTHAVQRIETPILLVRGRMSELVSEASVASFLRAVPAADYVDVADAAHMVAGDKNDVFCDAVMEFLTARLSPVRH